MHPISIIYKNVIDNQYRIWYDIFYKQKFRAGGRVLEKPFIFNKITEEVNIINVPADRFKTSEISISMVLPLKKETASVNALTAYLLSRSCAKYPDFTLLNRKLDELYGASLTASVFKIGEHQSMKLGITALDDRFSLDGTSISEECAQLLLDLLFDPRFEEGSFCADDVEMEKRLLIERIKSEENEKRIYAVNRLESEMFRNEPYRVNRFGTVADVEKITPDDVLDAWNRMLCTAKVLVTLVGTADSSSIAQKMKAAFSRVKRAPVPANKTVFIPRAETVNVVEERQEINQGKLVLGFRVDMQPDDPMVTAMRSTVDVFGGGPYSRLFMNVREKLSLCYYCNARFVRAKSMVLVQCGCEEENMEKAVAEICAQLKVIQDGGLLQSEFEASKIGLADAISGMNDNPEGLENWYALQMLDEEFLSPEQSCEKNNAVTFDQITCCAKKITLDTVYKLMGKKEDE